MSVFIPIRFTYNEDSNVIMTVIRIAAQMRGSESFRNKWLFLVYRQMVLSKDSVGLKCCEPLDDLMLFGVDLVGFSHVVGY